MRSHRYTAMSEGQKYIVAVCRASDMLRGKGYCMGWYTPNGLSIRASWKHNQKSYTTIEKAQDALDKKAIKYEYKYLDAVEFEGDKNAD